MAPSIEVKAVDDTHAITVPHPLTLETLEKRRLAAGKLVAGVAAPANSDMFKGTSSHHKPLAQRWEKYMARETLARQGNSLKKAAKFLKNPGLISLGGGLPSSDYFPFARLSATVPTVGHFTEKEMIEKGTTVSSGKHDLENDISLFDISTALQYGQGTGAAQMLRFVTEHTEIVHNPPYRDWNCTLTIGSTSALDMAFRMFCRDGDFVISEEYTFSAAVETAKPLGLRFLGGKMDKEGLLPDNLDEVLSSWDEAGRGARKPHLLYTVPTGQNPTGATQSEQRRRDLYAVCQKHDIFILEDEPYYFLQMDPYTGADVDAEAPRSQTQFLQSLVPSLLSMDVDGRVLRMDSFSKVIVPGSRIGWITASEQVVERYIKHADCSTQGPSGFSQLMLFKLLDEHWGHTGYVEWLRFIRMEYTTRRNSMLRACELYLPKDVVRWNPPMAGMFHWLEIDFRKHPEYPQKSILELEEEIFMSNIDHGTMLMRGSWFYADSEATHDTMFFRATYAAAPANKIEEAIKRFGDSVRASFGITEDKSLSNGHANGHANGHTNGTTNGHTNSAATQPLKRKSDSISE